MMTGNHDCPTFIAVNAEKLENCLNDLTLLHPVSEITDTADSELIPGGGNSPFWLSFCKSINAPALSG
ncbi:biofilm formation regulatory protein BssR [Leclercia adecarboxylata]|uniref:Biofilm formation regulatory protein BssR n=1 Tax=Leclercia adecarboxylata TaxID=83655 RepID=A0A4U9HN53_9ENTR|nr:biofilm formation regulatory protein BssR [Leclercia adecarboxylata]